MYTVSFNVLNCSCSQVTLLGIVRKYEQIQSVIACCGGFKILQFLKLFIVWCIILKCVYTVCAGDSCGKIFNWSERLSVLISVAKAIHFLHTGMIPGFFRNRLKTNNILFNENWMAKLSDYGLSIVSEETDASGVCFLSSLFCPAFHYIGGLACSTDTSN